MVLMLVRVVPGAGKEGGEIVMELFIMLCMIFGIMAPIFVPIAGGYIWLVFAGIKYFFPLIIFLCVLFLIIDAKRNPKKPNRGTLLAERAQLTKERDKLLKDKEVKPNG